MRFIASATRAPLHSVWHGAQSEGGSHGLPKRKSSAHAQDGKSCKQACKAPHRTTPYAIPLRRMRPVACGHQKWAKAARQDDLRQPPGTDMKHLIRHYIGAWRLARINNTSIGALREILNKPF